MAEARVETNVIRYARGRRPFLFKKINTSTENSEEGRENEADVHWWVEKSRGMQDWLRSNPLHLGMEDDAVHLVRSMLKKGEDSFDEEKQKRCWSHICIEMAGVPGNPLVQQDHDFLEEMLNISSQKPRTENLKSPETEDTQIFGESHLNHNNGKEEDQTNEMGAEECQWKESTAHMSTIDSLRMLEEKTLQRLASQKSLDEPNQKTQKTKLISDKDSESGSSLGSGRSGGAFRKAASTVMRKNKALSSMTLIERQEFMLLKKKAKTERFKAEQKEKEVEGCTYKPQKFTRRSSFANVESIVKKQNSPSMSLQGQGSITAALAHCGSSNSLFGSDSDANSIGGAEPKSGIYNCSTVTNGKNLKPPMGGSKSNFLEECRALMRAKGSSDNSLVSQESSLSVVTQQTTRKDGAKPPSDFKRRGSLKKRKSSRARDLEKALESSALLDACRGELEKSKKREDENSESSSPNSGDVDNKSELPTEDFESERGEEDFVEDSETLQGEEDGELGTTKRNFKFAESSTEHRGKIELQDFNEFQLDSFYRKRDRGSIKPGVTLLMGRRDDDLTEQVVAVIFDLSKFSEEDASEWLNMNLHRFPTGRRELRKSR